MLQYKFKLKKSIDGVLGIRTRGGRMEGANECTELWRHPHIEACDKLERSDEQDDNIDVSRVSALVASQSASEFSW